MVFFSEINWYNRYIILLKQQILLGFFIKCISIEKGGKLKGHEMRNRKVTDLNLLTVTSDSHVYDSSSHF